MCGVVMVEAGIVLRGRKINFHDFFCSNSCLFTELFLPLHPLSVKISGFYLDFFRGEDRSFTDFIDEKQDGESSLFLRC